MRLLLILGLVLGMTVPSLAGTISFQVVETGQTTATKSFTVADADIDRIVAAYQSAANTSINGTATRAQVLLYLAQQWMQSAVTYTQDVERRNATAAITTTPLPAN